MPGTVYRVRPYYNVLYNGGIVLNHGGYPGGGGEEDGSIPGVNVLLPV